MYVFIGPEALKYASESKYLGFRSSDLQCDDCDMLHQMRSLYAKSNRLLHTFSYCSMDVKWLIPLASQYLQGPHGSLKSLKVFKNMKSMESL